ncbi:hypothetical protein AU377_12410 [Sporosarcina sp. HYO08]|nr:hypothetical protein AU377_12410 [Sporosarcina sp. HYO08]
MTKWKEGYGCREDFIENLGFVFFPAIIGAAPDVMDPVLRSMNLMRRARRMINVIKEEDALVSVIKNSSAVFAAYAIKSIRVRRKDDTLVFFIAT